MTCRLCLIEIANGITISSDNGKSEIAKIIFKYFQVEVQPDDAISNEICCECFKHIDDFHRFWLDIDDKQRNLQKHLENAETKHQIVDIKTEDFPIAPFDSYVYDGNIGLHEPQIDLVLAQTELTEDEVEFDAAEMGNEASTDEDSLPSTAEKSNGK
ncbi:transcription factor grauzone-like, partial [Rhagoletis pomonella]